MQRAAGLALVFTLIGNANADCELLYAPPDIRAAALRFHHSVDERRSEQTPAIVREKPSKAPRGRQMAPHRVGTESSSLSPRRK